MLQHFDHFGLNAIYAMQSPPNRSTIQQVGECGREGGTFNLYHRTTKQKFVTANKVVGNSSKVAPKTDAKNQLSSAENTTINYCSTKNTTEETPGE